MDNHAIQHTGYPLQWHIRQWWWNHSWGMIWCWSTLNLLKPSETAGQTIVEIVIQNTYPFRCQWRSTDAEEGCLWSTSNGFCLSTTNTTCYNNGGTSYHHRLPVARRTKQKETFNRRPQSCKQLLMQNISWDICIHKFNSDTSRLLWQVVEVEKDSM